MNADKEIKANVMQQDIEKVSDMIVAAHQLLTDGEPIDLAQLERRVDALCQTIHANPPENSREVRQALAAIVNDLDSLEHQLNEQHRQLEQNLAEQTRKLAIEAYSDPKEPGENTPNGNN